MGRPCEGVAGTKEVLPVNDREVLNQWSHWLTGVPLLAFSLWLSVGHAVVFWKECVRREKAWSTVPFVAGVAGALGLLAIPVAGAKLWWWLPFMLDWATWPVMWYTSAMLYFDGHPQLYDVSEGKGLPVLPVISIWFAAVAIPVAGYAISRSSAWLEATGWIVGSVLFVTCAVLGVLISRPTK